MGTLRQDIRGALRRVRTDLGLSGVAIFTLALGIAGTTAIFTIVNAVLLRPLPYRDPSRVMILLETSKQFPKLSASYENFADWRDQSHSFESFGAARNTTITLTGIGEPEQLPAQMATATLFAALGVKPELGRSFTAEDERTGAAPVVLISHGLWQRLYAGSGEVLGHAITLDNKTYSVIGVLPAGYQVLLTVPDVVLPLGPWAATLPHDRNWHAGILPIARLKTGVTLQRAQSEMTVIARRLEAQYPAYDNGVGTLVIPIRQQLVENIRSPLIVLMGAVGFVLLIACTNVANLLLARASVRRREIALRSALGATRMRILRQILTESVVLAIPGALLGLIVARAAMPAIVHLAGSSLPQSRQVTMDVSVFLFTTVIAVGTGVLFGLAPARHAWRVNLRDALNEGSRGSATQAMLRTRSALVVVEVAFAMVLLVGAGLLIRSFERLSSISPGFSSDHLLLSDLPVSANTYREAPARMNFFDQVLEKTRALPGVKSAGATSFLPLSGGGGILHFNIRGRPPKSPHDYVHANYRAITAGYLETLQIPLLAGRSLQPADREDAPAVVLINAAMAKTFFANQSPLGQRIQIGGEPNTVAPWMEIVGVVGDVKESLANDVSAEMYVPLRQADKVLPVFLASIAVRTSGDPLSLAASMRRSIHDIDPNQPVVKTRTMDDVVSESATQPRFRTILLTIFAAVALVLSAVGIFSVMAYSVTQRRRELGVRLALGASRRQILQLVLGEGLKFTFIGIAIGLLAALALTRYLGSMLFGIRSFDPVTLVAMSLVIAMVSLLAAYIPAWRATRVDATVALRWE
jgi:putative ABC transport system permease protein